MKDKKRITVVGGSGFLGSHVCDKLSDAGHEVRIFDIIESRWLRPDQIMVLGDILDFDEVRQVVRESDVVFNFAGIADIGEANVRPVDTVRYNILGNTHILDACREANIERYIFASSVYVYSKAGGFYRCSKQASELYIESYYENFGLEYTILRYGSLYGPRADTRNAIYRFVKEALENKRIVYYGSPSSLREYIHVEDAALSSVEILKPGYANSNLILTGSQPMRVGDLLNMIAEMLGEEIEFTYQNDPASAHYEITPYAFSPKMGKKMSPRLHTDLGQGLLRVIEEIHESVHPELRNVNGLLINNEK